MQQTRIDQGLSYYHKFMSLFPTIKDLAFADVDQVLKAWQGLGYYSRARNLHKCAQTIVNEHDANFPNTYKELIKLPGIGPYTAAAISSICFNEAQAVLDGNVFRLLSRLFKIDAEINQAKSRPIFQEIANDLIDKKNPGAFNQAMMDFGSTVCKPKNPSCEDCVLQANCLAFADGTQLEFPKKKKSAPARKRYFTYLLIEQKGKIPVEKRGSKDIWEGLYQLPLIESENESEWLSHRAEAEKELAEPRAKYLSAPQQHKLSHQTIFAQLRTAAELPEELSNSDKFKWIDKEDFSNFAQPKLMEILWSDLEKDLPFD